MAALVSAYYNNVLLLGLLADKKNALMINN